MKLFSLIIVCFVFMSGCSTGPKYTVSPDWDKSTLATVYIYRTDVAFHSLNPEKPFFYIDDLEVGKLGTGQSLEVKVLPGKHSVSVKEPFLFSPSYENGRLEIEAKPNEKYYVRYSKDFSSIAIAGSTAVPTGRTTLHMANEEYYLERK